jgi:hypothetical protein
MAAITSILDTRWLSMGWRPQSPDDSEPMAKVFISELDRHGIPYRHWPELYRRGIDLRRKRLAQGLQCEDFSVDLMIACWPQLKDELREQEVAAGRTLTASAETQCERCQGSGWEDVTIAGRSYRRKGCTHEPLDQESVAS